MTKNSFIAYDDLTKFERKLLNSWLRNMGVDPAKLSAGQKEEYSGYAVFQMLVMKVRADKEEAKTVFSRIRKFVKYRLPTVLLFAVYAALTASWWYVAYRYALKLFLF